MIDPQYRRATLKFAHFQFEFAHDEEPLVHHVQGLGMYCSWMEEKLFKKAIAHEALLEQQNQVLMWLYWGGAKEHLAKKRLFCGDVLLCSILS